jgi:DNA-binding MarR family transcriptional regulator
MTSSEQTRGRKSPTSKELAIWRRYVETGEALNQQLAARMKLEADISVGDYTVLLALSEADGHSLRSSALAEVIGWDRSRLSHHVKRMEERNLIVRSAVEGDNRASRVTASGEGLNVFRRASVSHLRLIKTLFVDAFTETQLAGVDDLVGHLRAHFEADIV